MRALTILTILSVLQTACLLFLVYAMSFNRDGGEGRFATSSGVADAAQSAAVVSEGHQPLDEMKLRRIIRDELTAQANSAAGVPPSTIQMRNPAEDQLRKERLDRQLDDYKRLGVISPMQMQDLQEEMARLDKVSQKAVLRKLMRALNSGEIKGRF